VAKALLNGNHLCVNLAAEHDGFQLKGKDELIYDYEGYENLNPPATSLSAPSSIHSGDKVKVIGGVTGALQPSFFFYPSTPSAATH